MDAWNQFNEALFSLLARPDDKPENISYESVLTTIQTLDTIAQAENTSHAHAEETLSAERDPYIHAEKTLSFILSLREIFPLPLYRETILHATTEEWEHAHEDSRTFCHIFCDLAALLPKRNAHITAGMRQTLVALLGQHPSSAPARRTDCWIWRMD